MSSTKALRREPWGPAPRTYIRSEDQFIREAFRLNLPGLSAVRSALALNDSDSAWAALLKFYAPRKPHAPPQSRKGLSMARAVREASDNLSSLRVGGRIDWDHGGRPARKDWEKYWGRANLGFIKRWLPAASAPAGAVVRRAIANLFLEWYRDCPVPDLPHGAWWDRERHGFTWREIEAGVRGRMLVGLFLASRSWREAPEAFHRALLLSIKQHMDYLVTYYARFGFIEGNHQTHHAFGPLAAGLLIPEFRAAAGWCALGLRILREHLASDHDPDGVQNEHSASYHAGVLAMYLDALKSFRAAKRPAPRWLRCAVSHMADFVMYAATPAGVSVPINDSGAASFLPLLDELADVLARRDLTVFAAKGRLSPCPPASRAFRSAGFAFMRSGWDSKATYAVLDASGHNSGHWHAGKPNLVLYKGGQPLAAEHQFATYDDAFFWKYFHHARAHNTVLVDGEGDGTPKSPWLFEHSSHPSPDCFVAGERADVARASTDGFARLSAPVTFERTVVFLKPDLVFVHDWLESAQAHMYEWLLHLAPQSPRINKAARSMTTGTGGRST